MLSHMCFNAISVRQAGQVSIVHCFMFNLSLVGRIKSINSLAIPRLLHHFLCIVINNWKKSVKDIPLLVLYTRGMDGQLRLCVCENEYIPILQCVHLGIGAGHFSGASTAKQVIYSGLW